MLLIHFKETAHKSNFFVNQTTLATLYDVSDSLKILLRVVCESDYTSHVRTYQPGHLEIHEQTRYVCDKVYHLI